jgi:hypothetical protein
MIGVEQSVEWLIVETKVLGENLFLFHFVNHKSHMTWPEPGPPRWEYNYSNLGRKLWGNLGNDMAALTFGYAKAGLSLAETACPTQP